MCSLRRHGFQTSGTCTHHRYQPPARKVHIWIWLHDCCLLKGTTCSLCGTRLHSSEVEVDHIIPRARFKDPQEADSMDNLQTLCTPCHRAKTKTDLKVLSRMR